MPRKHLWVRAQSPSHVSSESQQTIPPTPPSNHTTRAASLTAVATSFVTIHLGPLLLSLPVLNILHNFCPSLSPAPHLPTATSLHETSHETNPTVLSSAHSTSSLPYDGFTRVHGEVADEPSREEEGFWVE